MKYSLEICCYSPTDIASAWLGGANRAELCSGYSVGGTTPSIGSLKLALELSQIPIYVMIRPRGGNFVYTKSEIKEMFYDAEKIIECGAKGLVIGALTNDYFIDKNVCNEFVKQFSTVDITFHRAFDLCKNPLKGLDDLIDIGIKRVLTSGQKNKAIEGIETLSKMVEQAGNEIEIMVGSGVNIDNIKHFAAIDIKAFHSSASAIVSLNENINDDAISFNANLKNNQKVEVQKEKVQALKNYLDSIS